MKLVIAIRKLSVGLGLAWLAVGCLDLALQAKPQDEPKAQKQTKSVKEEAKPTRTPSPRLLPARWTTFGPGIGSKSSIESGLEESLTK